LAPIDADGPELANPRGRGPVPTAEALSEIFAGIERAPKVTGTIPPCSGPPGSLERLRYFCAFAAVFLAFSVLQPAWAVEPVPTAVDGTPPDVQVGDTYAQVVAAKGQPSSQIALGDVRILYYPNENLRFEKDVVVKVEPVAKRPPPVVGVPAPAPLPSAVPTGDYGPPRQVELVYDDVQKKIGAFAQATRAKFKEGGFADIERVAGRFIADRARFGDGLWRIVALHEALELPANTNEEAWTARESDIEKWEAQFPLSITARVVHIQFLTSYAWHARGSGYAGSVKDEAWPIFSNRLAQAYILYQSALKLDQKSPMLWLAGQVIAVGQGWPVEEVSRQFEIAKATEPEFWPYDSGFATFLLPRWYGKVGDWEAFAAAEMRRENGLGAEGYARLVFALHSYYKNIFTDSHAQWAPVKEGYSRMIKAYPGAKNLLSQYAYLAVQAADMPSARAAFEAMKGQGDPSVWSADSVARFQAWAYYRP
jgi:hypothetical protein